MAKANAIIQVKMQSFVWSKVHLTQSGIILIGSLFFVFLAFKRYHMVNSSTIQYLLLVFGLSFAKHCQSAQRQSELLQSQT